MNFGILHLARPGLALSEAWRILRPQGRFGFTAWANPEEANLDVIRNADWIIDMGPEGGSKGGKVMFEGTPKQLLTAKQSLTSAYLGRGARV